MQTTALVAGPRVPAPISDDAERAFVARAQPPIGGFHWHLEYVCDGAIYVWHGKGHSPGEVDRLARAELSHDQAGFNSGARRVSCAYSAVMWPCACGARS